MNYHQYPIPPWSTPEKWEYLIKNESYKVDCIIRDGYKCQDCKDGSKKLLVHHIDNSRKLGRLKINNNPSNLVTLCSPCHAVRHGYKKSKVERSNLLELFEKYSSEKMLMPGASTMISLEIGLTRERVRQLANKMGYITYLNKLNTFNKKGCLYCGKTGVKKNRKYCSIDCSKMAAFYIHHVLVQCKNCKLYFVAQKNDVENSGRKFCNKICFGNFAGTNFGFTAHPENGIGYLYKKSRFDIKELEVFKEGFTIADIAKKYNYTSIGGAYAAIRNLILSGKVEKYKIKGLYRVKKNPSLTEVV